MNFFKKVALSAILAVTAASAAATPIFAGSWNLYSGMNWSTRTAPTLTAQEAAASLFGGVAADYIISTTGTAVGSIDHKAWYDQYGIGPAMFAENYEVDVNHNGLYDSHGDTSAMIRDNASGRGLINYAFRVDANPVPEPVSLGLLGIGLLGLGVARRRQSK